MDVLGFRRDPIDAEGWSFLTRDNFRVMLGECQNEKPASDLGDKPWGLREFGLRTPDGHRITCDEPIQSR